MQRAHVLPEDLDWEAGTLQTPRGETSLRNVVGDDLTDNQTKTDQELEHPLQREGSCWRKQRVSQEIAQDKGHCGLSLDPELILLVKGFLQALSGEGIQNPMIYPYILLYEFTYGI